MTELWRSATLKYAVRVPGALALLLLLMVPAAPSAQEKLVRYRDIITTPVGTFGLPVELYLEAVSDTQVTVKFAANMMPVQKRLPQLLSAFLVDDCDLRVGLQVDDSQAKGDRIHLDGRLQAKIYTCDKTQNKETRFDLVTLDFDVQVVLGLSVVTNCIRWSLDTITLTPTNLASELVNAFGVSDDLIATARSTAEDHLESYSGCMGFPEPLRVVDARIVSAGFRDFGEGTLGVVVKGQVDTRSDKIIDLFVWLFERGHLEPEEGVAVGSFSFRAIDIQQ